MTIINNKYEDDDFNNCNAVNDDNNANVKDIF